MTRTENTNTWINVPVIWSRLLLLMAPGCMHGLCSNTMPSSLPACTAMPVSLSPCDTSLQAKLPTPSRRAAVMLRPRPTSASSKSSRSPMPTAAPSDPLLDLQKTSHAKFLHHSPSTPEDSSHAPNPEPQPHDIPSRTCRKEAAPR